ncbi:Protein CBR-SPAS-1 [Caenorhabditis briggsae]|uniref:Probable spastin homolog spas-1 n=1 Tax=Caenorhabditis briggsae TaxID=6238 RepID=SPAST_CAEBR|nr:Protein CBR-SPAS-1 [Caenorhabditis briggsae]A8XV40.2 RecName: Full=Probable spastin homolog spas-1 [Caenorhabditis briggsae]CAP36507.2 Protein CBR-SPAS-1 [Caenorhabditis briggsae]
MFAFSKAPAGCSTYERVTQKFQDGSNKLRAAIEMDELTKQNGTINEKLQTAELYKQARQMLKEANEFNIMDIPESKRSEVREKREKTLNLEKSAQDRLIKICNEVDPNMKRASTAADPCRAARITPRNTRATVPGDKKVSKVKQTEKAPHVCSRGDRCGAHQPPPEKKSTPLKPVNQIRTRVKENKNPIGVQQQVFSFILSCCMRRNCRRPHYLFPCMISLKMNYFKFQATLPNQLNTVNRSNLLKGVDKAIGERLLDEILDSTGVRMDDVAGCHSAKATLEEAVILPALNPNLFSGLRQPVKGILLFGPPGNGKTLLAKAVAGESKQMFFNISASSLTSKWVGDSEKTIRGLFQIARNGQPSIIFIDEIDSILCERSEKDAEVSRRMKTEFLVQFDGATSSPDDRILVIGATNRPYELDDAVLRRFPKRIMLNLPDTEARKELITNTLKKHDMMDGLSSSDIRYIASNTSGFSNSDLVALCKEAAMVPVREIHRSKLSVTDGDKIRKIRASDFDTALRTIRPSTSDRILSKLSDFSRNFGC